MDYSTGGPESRQGRGQMGRGTILNHMVMNDLTEMETFQLKNLGVEEEKQGDQL